MRKTKYCTSSFLIVFLMLTILSTIQLDNYSISQNHINLNVDNNTESWSRIIKSGSQLSNPSMTEIDNHTYIMGSIGEYYTSDDIYLAKFNSSGVKLWEQIWGGSEYDYIKGCTIDSEDNIYIVGITSETYVVQSGRLFLLKYNTTGNLLWSKTIDPFSSNYYKIHSIQTGLNNSIYITCTIMYNYTDGMSFFIQLNTSGDILWTQKIGLESQPYKLMTKIDSVGNFYFYGQGSELNLFILKLNSSGSRQWYSEWGEGEYGYHLKFDLDDNIILTGISYNYGFYDVWIMKMNPSGNLTKKIICNSFGGYGLPKFKVWFLENIFVLTGSSLLEYNYSLNSKWNYAFGNNIPIGDSGNFNFDINSQQEKYFSYLNYGVIYILKFNSSGAIVSNFKWGGSYHDYLQKIMIDSKDNLYMLCNIYYVNIWNEGKDLTILVKNPKSDGKIPQLEHLIDDRDFFIFFLLGVMSFISILLIFTTLKPEIRK